MPENFQAEQGKVSSVEKKAGQLEGGKKKGEKLETELKAKHDVFFKQVTATEKVFAEADKLKYNDEKQVMNKDKTEIKDLLTKVATNGEDILTKNEENPDLQTIRQSADRINKITNTVADNLAFFKDMEQADASYQIAKDSLDDGKKFDPKKDEDSKKRYIQGIDQALTNLGELGALGYLENQKNVSTPELKIFYTHIKDNVDSAFEEATNLKVKYAMEFEYDTDEKKEKMPPGVKKLMDIKSGGAPTGPYGVGFDSLGRMMSVYKKSLRDLSIPTYESGTLKTEDDKKVTIKNARNAFMDVNKSAEKIRDVLEAMDPKDLPDEYQAIYYRMKTGAAAYMDSSFEEVNKIDQGHENVDSNAVLGEVEKAYDGEPKKKYEAAIAEKDKVMKDPKFADKLGNYNKLASAVELKDDPEKDAKNPDVLNDKDLYGAIEDGLSALAPLSGKLQSIDRTQLMSPDQKKFDELKASIDGKIQELMQVKLLLQNYHLAASVGERNRGEGKDRPKYFNFVVKTIEGQQVIGMEPTEEFKKLSPEKQKEIMKEFEAVPYAAAIDLERKMKLPEDKDWENGMRQFEQGNWQKAKLTLLAYFNRFQGVPEKTMQINATRGILQGIVRKELEDCKERLLMFEDEYNKGFSTEDTNRAQIMASMDAVWKNFAAAEKAAATGQFVTLDDIWNKVGKPQAWKVKAGGFEFLNPREQQHMLEEPDPEIRRNNILILAKAANKAGLKSYAKKYYDMYFEDQLKASKKSVDKDAVLKKFHEENHDKEIDAAMEAAHQQERTKFITYINATRGMNNVGIDAENQKIFDKYDADYAAADKGKIRTQIIAGMEQEAINKAAKVSLHHEMMSVPDGIHSNGSDEWKEAYGGTFNVVENIDNKFFVTESDVGTWAMTYAIKFEALAAAIAMGMLTGGAAAGFAAEMGMGAGALGTGGVGFIVDGAVMHFTLTALTEGDAGFKDPAAFGKGLLMTYATMGLLKGTGEVLGKIAKVGYVAKGLGALGRVAEGSTAGAVGVGALKLTGKSILDATILTGLSAATSPLLNGKSMSLDDMQHSFADNVMTCFVMGAFHGAAESKPEAKTDLKGFVPEQIKTGEAIDKATKANLEVDAAKEKLAKAKAEGKPTEKLEADLKDKQAKAKEADTKMVEAEKAEGEARKSNLESLKKALQDKIAEQQKEGKVNPELVARLKITEALLESVKGGEAPDAGPYRTPGGIKIDAESLGIFQRYTEAVLSKDTAKLSELRSLYPNHADMFGIIDNEASAVKTPREAIIHLITGEVSVAIEGQKFNTPEDIAAFVDAYNAKNKPVTEGDPQIVAKLPEGKGVLIIDKNGKLQYLEKSAADTHFNSVFSSGIPDSMVTEGKASKDVPAWIDTDGKVHYNSDYFKAKYGVEMKQVEGKDGKMVNVFVVDGVEMGAKDFFKNHPKGKEVLDVMKKEKNHEVTHRLIEAADQASGGKLGERLIATVNADPALSALFAKRGVEMNSRNVQEFMAEIADGRYDHELTMDGKQKLETAIGGSNVKPSEGGIPGFSFEKARQIDTQGLQFNSPDIFKRSTADASYDGKSGILKVGDQINIPGSRMQGKFIAGVLADGTLIVTSNLTGSIGNAGNYEQVKWNDILAGTTFNGKRIIGVTSDGRVMFEKQPGQPFSETAQLSEVLGLAPPPKNYLTVGDNISMVSPKGNAIYDNCRIDFINPNGQVVVSYMEGGVQKQMTYANMDALSRYVDAAEAVRKLPQSIDLVNQAGGIDKGWTVTRVDMQTGGITLQSPDGRTFQAPTMDVLYKQMQTAEAAKAKIKEGMDTKLQQLPPVIDLIATDGSISDGWKVEAVDYENNKVRVRSKDGKLTLDMKMEDLQAHVDQAAKMKAPQNMPVAPNYAPVAPKGSYERNDVKQPPEKVHRSSEVGAVGDLHGNFDIMLDSLKQLGMIPQNATSINDIQWTGGNKRLVFQGDILADRNANSFKVMEAIRKLQVEAAKQGGSVDLIAGNHEDFALAFLTGKKVPGLKGGPLMDLSNYLFVGTQATGIIEFAKKFSGDPALSNITSATDPAFIERFMKPPPLGPEILKNMRQSPEGRQILEQMASMKVVEYIDDTLFMHTELTPEILSLFQGDATMGQRVDQINKIYQQGLRFQLLGEGTMPPNFDVISNTFLGTYNKGYTHSPGDLKWMNDHGVNHIVHGHTHSEVGSNVDATSDGVKIIGVDHSAGKGGGGLKPGKNLSIGVIKTNGQFSDTP